VYDRLRPRASKARAAAPPASASGQAPYHFGWRTREHLFSILAMPKAPWVVPSGVGAVVDRWLASGTVRPCFAADRTLEPTAGRDVPLPDTLEPGLRRALGERGVKALYTHQAEALSSALSGKHFVVATPTASGKSLCFHLPVLSTLARDKDARALYLYPTKALSRDQEASLGELIHEASIDVARIVYDGDTPGDARRAARERGGVVMTNPDMLSTGILPHHAQWARMFQGLKFVVLDELHTYRGVFGSHMAHVIARLWRIARFHGSSPVFCCATATIGNPLEHASRLLGVKESEITLIDRSGAPRGGRRFFIYNPPVVNAELGIRASYLKSAVMLAGDLLEHGVPTIVFGPSRNSVEIMLKYLRARLEGVVDADRIMAYRGGYLPNKRREIERDLRSGSILGVVSTNALELGIDIGSLDAVVCAGYPGSIASTWQRFGRAGRKSGGSIAVMALSSHALDQYFAKQPDQLLDAGAEEARIDPGNVEIVLQHLKCAAFELPFVQNEAYACLDADATRDALRFLAKHGVVHEAGGRFHWAADAYPANHVSLRSVGWDNVVIIDRTMGRVIAELDWRATHTMLHEQAIYQQDGEQYQVEKLDLENHKAFVTKVEPDYFTTALTNRVVTVIDETAHDKCGPCTSSWGEVSVVEKIVGYKKIKFFTHENAGYGDVHLPDMQMHTTSFWLTVPESVFADLGRASAIDALRGIGRALETVATIALMCEPQDIGQSLGDKSPESAGEDAGHFDPTLYLFDRMPGGIGLAERIYELLPVLLGRTLTAIRGCSCEDGCPACVGPTEGLAGRRAAAITLLQRMTG
jgi:DEAD/DEAH box helicase domain-containing protein